MADLSVETAQLLAPEAALTWPEAVALIQALAAAHTADLSSSRVHPDGRLFAPVADEPATPAALAKLLQELLPRPGSAVEPRVPAGLRYTVIRALGGITAPPIASLEEFSQSLARFEQGDRAALLAGAFARWKAGSQVHAERAEAAEAVPPPAWDSVTIDATDDPAGGLWLHPDEEPAAPRRRQPRTRPAGRVLTSLVAVSILLAAGVVAAAVALGEGRRQSPLVAAIRPQLEKIRPQLEKVGPSLEKVRDWAAAGVKSIAGKGDASPAETSSAAGGGGTGTRGTAGGSPAEAAPPGSPSPNAPAATGPAAAEPAPSVPLLPGRLVESLDVGQKPVFSPSFASDGSAIFFDRQTPAEGSAIKEAKTGGGSSTLQVLSVVDGGAKNYHPQLSPDGRTVAFDSDRDGVRGVYLSDRAGKDIRRISGEGYAAVPTWSPDGRQLAFVKAEEHDPRVWNVWTVNVGDGRLRRITSHRYGQPWGASWLPDGRRICYSYEDRIILLDLGSGARRFFLSPRKGTLVRTPAVSPDGRHAIFQLHRDGAWLLDLEDGSMRQVLDDPTAEEFAWSPDGKRVAFHSRRAGQWGIFVTEDSNGGQ